MRRLDFWALKEILTERGQRMILDCHRQFSDAKRVADTSHPGPRSMQGVFPNELSHLVTRVSR